MKKKLGAAIVPVLIIIWTILNLAGQSAPDRDIDDMPAQSWPQAIHSMVFGIGEITVVVGLIVTDFFMYDRWHNWRIREAQKRRESHSPR